MNKGYTSYKETNIDWLSRIPVHWDESRVKKYFKERNEKVDDIEYPPLSVTKNGILPQLEDVSKSDNHNDRKRVCRNDFVINSRSDRKGSSGISQLDGSVSLINIVLEPKNINPIFSEYLFKSKDFIEEFFRNGKGIHWDLWSTRYSELQNIKIPIPPLSEQQQIVSFLDTKTSLIDSLIEKTQQKIELLKEKRTSLINEVVTKGLNPNVEMKDSGVEWIGEIPSHWGILRGKYLFENIVDKNHPEEPLLSVTQKNSVVRRDEMENRVWNPDSDVSGYKLISKGDFVISLRTFEGGIELSEIQGIVSPVYTVLRRRQEINDIYFKFLLKSSTFITELNKITTGIRQGKNINYEDFSNIFLPIPEFEEQKKIGCHIDNQTQKIDKTISIEEKRIELLKEFRQSIISEVVTGKLKVVE